MCPDISFFTRFAEYQWHELTDSSKQFWWERFEVEGNNFRAALDWALMHPDERGLKLTAALGLFWYGTSRWTDERDRHIVQRFLDHATATQPSTTRARSLQMAALLATNEDDPITALPLAEESIAIAHALGDEGKSLLGLSLFVRCWANLMQDLPAAFDAAREGIKASREADDDVALGLALMIAGVVQRELGDYTAAREAYESSLGTFRKIDNEWMSANPQAFLGQWHSIHGDTVRAIEFLEPALKMHRDMNNRRMIGETLSFLGDVAELERNFELAAKHYEDSLTVFRELGSQQRIANALSNLGRIAWRNGDVEQAKVIYREGLPKFVGQPDKTIIAYATGYFACFLSSQGDVKSTAHLLGAVYAHFEVMGARIRPLVQAEFDRYLEVTQKTLGDEFFDATYAEGRAMSLEKAIVRGLGKI
jgi:tetratricopeptide (TPR) repeat protein